MLFHVAEARCANLHRHRLLSYRIALPDYQQGPSRRRVEQLTVRLLGRRGLALSEAVVAAAPLPLLAAEPAYRGAA